MLKQLPETLSPELLKIMMEMGHFDEIVLGDGNFPGASRAKRLLRFDGLGIPRLLNDMLQFFPLDDLEPHCAAVMEVSRKGYENPPVWKEYEAIIEKWEGKTNCIEQIPRHDFYARAGRAYAIISTSESALFGNIILKKGIVKKA